MMRTKEQILNQGVNAEIDQEVASLAGVFRDYIDHNDINYSQLCVSFEQRLRKLVDFAREAGPK